MNTNDRAASQERAQRATQSGSHHNINQYILNIYIYCTLRGRIKGYNRSITTIMCQLDARVVIELWLIDVIISKKHHSFI